MAREVWIVRGGGTPFLTSILNDNLVHGKAIARFDRFCMEPISRKAMQAAVILNLAIEGVTSTSIQWFEDKVLILDNWRVLHARGIAPRVEDEERILERTYVANGGF